MLKEVDPANWLKEVDAGAVEICVNSVGADEATLNGKELFCKPFKILDILEPEVTAPEKEGTEEAEEDVAGLSSRSSGSTYGGPLTSNLWEVGTHWSAHSSQSTADMAATSSSNSFSFLSWMLRTVS